MQSKVASYIGLAQRMGSVIYGEDKICEFKGRMIVLIDSSSPEKYVLRLKRRLEGKELYIVDGLKEALHKDNVYAVAILNGELIKVISELLR